MPKLLSYVNPNEENQTETSPLKWQNANLKKFWLRCESTWLLPFYQEKSQTVAWAEFAMLFAVQFLEVATSGNRRLPEFEVWQPVCTFRHQAAVNLSF